MRKLLALLLLVAVVTSAFAFANSFNVNSLPALAGQQNVSSGDAVIAQCATELEIDVTGGDYNPNHQDFDVGMVKLRAGANCAGDSVKVTLTRADNSAITTLTDFLDGSGSVDIDASSAHVAVKEVTHVYVLVEADNADTQVVP